MKKIKLIIKWVLCAIFILIGVTNILKEIFSSLSLIIYINNPFQILNVGFIVIGLIISPLFELFTKKINKKFSGLRKILLIYGVIFISIICSLIFANLYNESIIGYIWSVTLTLLFILLFTYIVCISNKHKYEEVLNNKWYKILFIIIILISVPYFILKGVLIAKYNNLIKELNINFIETKKIESKDLSNEEYYIFDNFKIQNKFKDYKIVNEEISTYHSIALKNEKVGEVKGVMFSNNDILKTNYDDILETTKENILYKFHPYVNLILSNKIDSEQNFCKYLSINQKVDIFDKIGDILYAFFLAKSYAPSINSFQMIEHSDYNISISTNNVSDKGNIKLIEIIDDDKIYTMTLFVSKEFNEEELYSLISTIKIT